MLNFAPGGSTTAIVAALLQRIHVTPVIQTGVTLPESFSLNRTTHEF